MDALLAAQEDEVDVRAIVELASAQLAHRQHGEAVQVHMQTPRCPGKTGAHDAFGKKGYL